jgi:hypothetical protein
MSIEAFEEGINEISDQDRNWWPFLWLRPTKDRELTLARLVLIAVLYGLPVGALGGLGMTLARPEMREGALVVAFAFPLTCLLFATTVVGPMWNRRAQRLRARAAVAPR